MSDLDKRLRASVRMGAIHGSADERAVCERQMLEAADALAARERELAEARADLAAVEAVEEGV